MAEADTDATPATVVAAGPRVTLARGVGPPELPVVAERVSVGSTQHFELYYDPRLATGAQLTDALSGTCEADYARLRRWFGTEPTYSWWADLFGVTRFRS